MEFKSPPIHRTPAYRAKAAYNGMLARCENANGKCPTYAGVKLKMTLEEWMAWAVPRYTAFSEANPGVSPSVSRPGDVGHYEIGNIEIVSVAENRALQRMVGQLRPDGTKRCSSCKEIQSSSEFSNNRGTKDRLAHSCKTCARVRYLNRPVTRAAKGADS